VGGERGGRGRCRGSQPVRRPSSRPSARCRSGASRRGSPMPTGNCGSRSAERRTEHVGGTLRVVSSSLRERRDFRLTPPSTSTLTASPWNAPARGWIGRVRADRGDHHHTSYPTWPPSLPTITPDGRRYTFQLREGTRYSNGELVETSDFRPCHRKGFPSRRGAIARFIRRSFAGIKGGEACSEEPRTCDLSSGIETDDAAGRSRSN
jgi:peptide/nickel transport system substrate-binding protein